MSDIDPKDVKPGDTVRIRVQSAAMTRAGVAPIDFPPTTVYLESGLKFAGTHILERSTAVTILEHIPARPDWAGALVVHAAGLEEYNKYLTQNGRLGHYRSAGGRLVSPKEMAQIGPITVVIDAAGNYPSELSSNPSNFDSKPMTVGDLNASHVGRRVALALGIPDFLIMAVEHDSDGETCFNGDEYISSATPCELIGEK